MIAKRKPAHASHGASNGNGSRFESYEAKPEIPDQLPTVEQQIAAVRTAINAASAAHILLLTANPTAETRGGKVNGARRCRNPPEPAGCDPP